MAIERWQLRTAIFGGIALGVLDLSVFWVLVLWTWFASATTASDPGSWLRYLLGAWNEVHQPVQSLINPLFYMDTSGSLLQRGLFALYIALCVLQSVAMGFLLALSYAIFRGRSYKRPKGRVD